MRLWFMAFHAFLVVGCVRCLIWVARDTDDPEVRECVDELEAKIAELKGLLYEAFYSKK